MSSSPPSLPWLKSVCDFILLLFFFALSSFAVYSFVNRIIWRWSQKLMTLTQLVRADEQVFFCCFFCSTHTLYWNTYNISKPRIYSVLASIHIVIFHQIRLKWLVSAWDLSLWCVCEWVSVWKRTFCTNTHKSRTQNNTDCTMLDGAICAPLEWVVVWCTWLKTCLILFVAGSSLA